MSRKSNSMVVSERLPEQMTGRSDEGRETGAWDARDAQAERSTNERGRRGERRAGFGAADVRQTRHQRADAPSGRQFLHWGAAATLTATRRIGQGVEITSREIRLVRLSCLAADGADGAPRFESERHLPGERQIRVDDAVCYPLAPGVVVGADIVDEAALIAALADCLKRQRARLGALAQGSQCDGEGERAGGIDGIDGDIGDGSGTAGHSAALDDHDAIALALCPSVVTQQAVWLEDLMPGFKMRLPRIVDEAAFDALEPWVLLYAQKISGIDAADIIVDWYRSAPHDPDRVTVAAAQRHYLEIRERVTRAAGASLSALGDAAAAALGACRFVVARCLHAPIEPEGASGLYPSPVMGPRFALPASGACQEARAALERINHRVASQRFAAVWIGENAWRAWTFDAGGASLEGVALPQTGDAKAVVAKLRASAPGPLGLVLVAGEREWLEAAGGMRGIGEALGCPAIAFDASSCCVGPAATPQQLGPGLAVAFGLALRELQL